MLSEDEAIHTAHFFKYLKGDQKYYTEKHKAKLEQSNLWIKEKNMVPTMPRLSQDAILSVTVKLSNQRFTKLTIIGKNF